MMRSLTFLGCLASGVYCCAGAAMDVDEETSESTKSDHPYQVIADRNVFSLREPAPPPPPEETTKQPVPKITLLGITTLFGEKTAMLKTPAPAAKPGTPPKPEEFYLIAEGFKDRDLEVVHIDEKAGVVDVVCAGTPVSLNFTDNGAKANPVAPPGVVPQPGMPGAPGGAGTLRPLPSRPLRLPTPGGTGNTAPNPAYSGMSPSPTRNYGGTGNLAVQTAGGQNLNLYGNRTAGGNTPQEPPAVDPISPEQHMIILEAERMRTSQQVDAGLLPPLPPTPLTPPGAPGSVNPNPTPSEE